MRDSWQARIARAAELAGRDDAARPLLGAYGRLLALQQECAQLLARSADGLSGSLERDLPAIRRCVSPVLNGVIAAGPAALADEARRILAGAESALDDLLLTGWHARSGHLFFAKLILQPYAEHLAATRTRPIDRDLEQDSYGCPFCGGAPQLSTLQGASGADGSARHLMCATCFTTWPTRRVCCARCGEEDERRLGYYRSAAFDHLRVDACDTCRHYLKTVDLTRLGRAIPLVDEVAGAALDLWAVDRGYSKIELNVMGL